MSHEYRDLMKNGVCNDPSPTSSGNGGSGWKVLLGISVALLLLCLVIK